jgi:probable aminopeptidase NPEPL1
VLCLAENAVGPDSVRPDDVLTLYSGKTVEVNNTDAEGRLVLGDGVAWAVRRLDPSVIVDMATLTGAQMTATGRRHAAIICNDADLERRTLEAGRLSGDLAHPLPHCPEFFRKEFKSKIADMKNSVADRANAQSSCAAQFVHNHVAPWTGPWLHVDIAGPASSMERATGYGVALLLTLFA